MQNHSLLPQKVIKKNRFSSLFQILILGLISLGCGTFTIQAPASSSSSKNIQAIEVARVAVGPNVAKVTAPQGAEVIFSSGALLESSTLVINQLKGKPASISALGAIPVGEGYEIKFIDDKKLNKPVEISLSIKTASGVDPTYYTVYRSEDGIEWVDIGGRIEGGRIKAWTDHFTIFWPAQIPAPLRPIEFVNQGWYDAEIFVESYQPDPYYAPAAPPGGMAVSVAPSTLPALNPGRYLLLPVGGYTFCYQWLNPTYFHAHTALIGLFDYDPKYIEGARWIIITPGREAVIHPGMCDIRPAARVIPAGGATRTFTPTVPAKPGIGEPKTQTPTLHILTPTRTHTPILPGAVTTRTPTKTLVNYLPYYNAWLKKIDTLRLEYQKKNCVPSYSGCFEDIFGMPTPARVYLYTYYNVNLHSSYVTFAQSLEDQLLAELKKCFDYYMGLSKSINLDVRKGMQGKCINDNVGGLWDRESLRIHETSCRAMCGELGKIGVVEGVPKTCSCK